MTIKVSVVVPIYGVEKYLRQCLDSLAAQTFDAIEFLLVDDGSKDGCSGIIDEYAAKDSRFIAIHQSNGGYGRAVNHGLEEAKGDYVGIVEPDDWIDSEMYGALYKQAVKTNADVVKCGFISVNVKTRAEKEVRFFVRDEAFSIEEGVCFLQDHPSIWTCLYRKGFLQENDIRMLETDGAVWQDNLFMVQTLLQARCIASIPGCHYHYRVFDYHLKNFLVPLECSRVINEWLSIHPVESIVLKRALAGRFLCYYGMALNAIGIRELLNNAYLFRRQIGYVDSGIAFAPEAPTWMKDMYRRFSHSPLVAWLLSRVGPRILLKKLVGRHILSLYRVMRYGRNS